MDPNVYLDAGIYEILWQGGEEKCGSLPNQKVITDFLRMALDDEEESNLVFFFEDHSAKFSPLTPPNNFVGLPNSASGSSYVDEPSLEDLIYYGKCGNGPEAWHDHVLPYGPLKAIWGPVILP